MLSILNTQTQQAKGHKKNFGGDRYVYNLDCGNGIMGVCICLNSSKYIH